MATSLTAEIGISGTSMDLVLSGFTIEDNNGRYIVPSSSLQVGLNNGALYIKQNGHTILVLTDYAQLSTINGTPVTSLDMILDVFKALI